MTGFAFITTTLPSTKSFESTSRGPSDATLPAARTRAVPVWATGSVYAAAWPATRDSRVTPGCIQTSAVVWANAIRSKALAGKTWTRSRPSGASRTGPGNEGLPSFAMSRNESRNRRAMRTKVPTPANSSSPASVEPGSRPLASHAAASQSSSAAMVASITSCNSVARADASVFAQPGA